MIEFIFEVFGELLLQAIGETLIQTGFRSLGEPFRRQPNPWLAAFGFVLFGTVLGGLSLLIFPNNFAAETWRIANLLITPILVGGLMMLIGAWRAKRGEPTLRIDKFSYGYLFALALGLVRYFFAN